MPSPAAAAPIMPNAAAAVRAAIRLAGGREVCFVCKVDEAGVIQAARVVARGDIRSVLALPGFAQRGEMLLHNHPSGNLRPSQQDIDLTKKIREGGKLLEIQVSDHIIVTNEGYYSFADEGLC